MPRGNVQGKCPVFYPFDFTALLVFLTVLYEGHGTQGFRLGPFRRDGPVKEPADLQGEVQVLPLGAPRPPS